jgi:hypothetical protein
MNVDSRLLIDQQGDTVSTSVLKPGDSTVIEYPAGARLGKL